MFRADLFKGKRFLVTGGGTGLGRIMMEKFVELGADCVICGRRGGVLEETAKQVMAKHPGRRVDTHAVDIRVATAVEEMIDSIWASGPLDGLVNNAAGNFISQTKDLSPRAFDAIANIVLHGTFYTTNACGRRWIAEQRKASVISILTTWVWTGSPFVVPSAMSKAGVAVMTQSLAVEWGRHGIRLNAIAPGPFPTEGAFSRLLPGSYMEKQALARIPSRRFGRHEELTNLVAYLLSDASPYLTGDEVVLDGAEALFSGQQFASFAHLPREQAKAFMASLKPKK